MKLPRTLPRVRHHMLRCGTTIAAVFFLGSICNAQTKPKAQQPEPPWTQDLQKYPGLSAELGRLAVKLQRDVQFPAARSESHLLALLPASTVYFAAIPNYGAVARQVLKVFREELAQSAPLRDWYTHGELAVEGPKLEESLGKFSQVEEYLGDEFVVSGGLQDRELNVVVVAEVTKPGLKKYLEEIIGQFGNKSKTAVRVLDPQGLATAEPNAKGGEKGLIVLVRPDYVVAALDLATLRGFNAQLDRKGQEFFSTPFGHRIAQEYGGGVTLLAAANLQEILTQSSPSTKENATFQHSGFADMKYLVWDRKQVAEQTLSQTELSFRTPRHGAASWLGKPAPLGSLDFVSPQAMAAISVMLSNPAQIFEDLKELSSNPNNASSSPFAAVPAFEQMLKLNLKDDLLNLLGGELTLEVDTITPPQPVWKVILGVNDAEHLKQTLSTLLTAAHFETGHTTDGDVTYYSVRIPSGKTTIEIGYAFVDGYLVIGSSRDVVAEAVALHNSGGSLRKSAKFLASLPPGRALDASALIYEDPIAFAALQLRQFVPVMAESLARYSSEAAPVVICFYGDEKAIREASRGSAFDVGGVMIAAAIAIPNLLRSRIAANEASAVGSVRTVNTAQITYEATYPKRGFAPNLAALGNDPDKPTAYSEDHAGILDESLANPSCAGAGWCTKSGYRFRISAVCEGPLCTEYVVVAVPVDSNTGGRSFCSTSDGVIRSKVGVLPTPDVSVSECKAWAALQ